MEEKDLRALLRPRGPRRRNPWRCLNETTLAAFADGQLEGKARIKAESHLAACSHCRAQLSDLVALASLEALPQVPPDLLVQARELAASQPRLLTARVWQWSVVASALAVVLLVVTVQRRQPASMPGPLTPVTPQIEESSSPSPPKVPEAVPRPDRSRSFNAKSAIPTLLSPQEGTMLASKQSEFRWTGVPGALFYEVEVLTVDGNIVWTGRAQGTQVAIPKQAALKQGKYFVWVRAHLADGKTRKSQAVSFQISAER